MARRSLRPHLNQIRGWVRQGRTDAWIAHQLEVTVQQIEAFKRENDLVPDGEADGALATGSAGGGDFDDEIDLRAEDDALIAAELEAAEAARAEEEARRAAEAAEAAEAGEDDDEQDDDDDEDEDEDAARKRRRGRRGGRTRTRRRTSSYEGTFDHGDEGYGLWLDPAIADDGVYAEHWAGHRPVSVTIEENQIVIRRAGDDEDVDDD